MSRLEALEHLYSLASKRRLRLRRRCACCTTEAMVAEVKSVPLRELPWEPANWLLYSTFGDGEDRLACLPRLLELTSPGTFERELLQKQLRLALSTREEDAAVHAYLSEEFLEGLAMPPRDLLEPALALGLGERLLGLRDASPVAPRWYARLLCEIAAKRNAVGLSGPESVLIDALLVEPRLESLERAFFLAEEPADQRLFSSAIQVLEWFA